MDESPQRALSRGRLLKLGAAAALGIGALPAAAAAMGEAATETNLRVTGRSVGGPRQLRLATYQPLVGDIFQIHRVGAQPLPVTLIAADTLPGAGETFSLVFRGRSNAKLEQSTYTFEHPRIGAYPLFLVPIGRAVHGQDFQVIVSRLPAARGPVG